VKTTLLIQILTYSKSIVVEDFVFNLSCSGLNTQKTDLTAHE